MHNPHTVSHTMQRRPREMSPVGRRVLDLGDVSSARSAGRPEEHEKDLENLRDFLDEVRSVFPKEILIEEHEPRYGSFIVPMRVLIPHDFVPFANRVKKKFPLATCTATGLGNYKWELPYERKVAGRPWGVIAFYIVALLFLAVFTAYIL